MMKAGSPAHACRLMVLLLAVAAAGCSARSPMVVEDARLALFAGSCTSPAPLLLAPGERIPDRFIVVFDDATADPNARTMQLEAQYDFTAIHRYSSALKGFAAELPPATVAALRCEAGVKYIEEDAMMSLGG